MDLHSAIVAAVRERIGDARIELELQGNKALVSIVSTAFADKTRVERSKLVYQCIDALIRSGDLHAVTIRAWTPEESAAKDSAAKDHG